MWYIGGTILLIPTFLGTFQDCLICKWSGNHSRGLQLFYYLLLPSLFNIGWATVQISNMSLAISVSYSQKRRDRLVSLRNGFTYVSNVTVLLLAFLLFQFIKEPKQQFAVLSYIITAIGVTLSIVYLIGVREIPLSEEAKRLDDIYKSSQEHSLKLMEGDASYNGQMAKLNDSDKPSQLIPDIEEEEGGAQNKPGEITHWSQWLKEGAFYVHGVVYMFGRLAMNVTMTLMPFYVKNVLEYGSNTDENETPIEIALVPLTSYAASIVFSLFFYKRIMARFGNRFVPLIIAVVLITIASVPFLFMQKSFRGLIYACTPIQGVGLAMLLNTATSLISDVIGNDDKSSAFVYGSYSLLDKFSSGIVLTIVSAYTLENDLGLRLLSGILPPVSAVLAFVFTYIGQKLYKDRMRTVSLRT